MAKKRYSDPKLYVAKENGKTSVAPGKKWFVYFYWRTDPNGKYDRKFTFNKGINRYKTAKERRAAGEAVKEGYRAALERGWNPVTKTTGTTKKIRKSTTLESGLRYAYEIKAKTKKGPTLNGYNFHLERFLEWAKNNGYLGMDVKKFEIDHFYEFLDWLRFEYVNEKTGVAISGSSVNNHKASLSALFTQMKNERLIPVNFVKDIPRVDADPVNNKPFTLEEIKTIKSELQKDDPYLIPFISFILYPLLRVGEVCRLRVKDLNTKNWFLSVETKTDQISHRRIIKKLKPVVEDMKLDKTPGDCHVFSNENRPLVWEASEKTKVDHFGKRFRKIKKKLGFGREYGLYSFRHSAILNLYNSMVAKGMGEQKILFELMPITQHKSVAGIKNYLRKHKKSIPPDHSDIYTIDF